MSALALCQNEMQGKLDLDFGKVWVERSDGLFGKHGLNDVTMINGNDSFNFGFSVISGKPNVTLNYLCTDSEMESGCERIAYKEAHDRLGVQPGFIPTGSQPLCIWAIEALFGQIPLSVRHPLLQGRKHKDRSLVVMPLGLLSNFAGKGHEKFGVLVEDKVGMLVPQVVSRFSSELLYHSPKSAIAAMCVPKDLCVSE